MDDMQINMSEADRSPVVTVTVSLFGNTADLQLDAALVRREEFRAALYSRVVRWSCRFHRRVQSELTTLFPVTPHEIADAILRDLERQFSVREAAS